MMDSPEMSPLSSLPSSQESTPSLDGRDSSESTPITSAEQTPTPKKREPKPRLGPQTIDFQAPITDAAALKVQKKQIDRLVKVLQKKKKIVVIAGAGISVNAGSKLPLPVFLLHLAKKYRLQFPTFEVPQDYLARFVQSTN